MNSGSVLLVDDEPLVARLYGRAIASVGLTPRFADDGEAALEAIEAEAPLLVMTDLNMPGMGGFTFIEKLIDRQLKTFPVILASADDTVELLANGLAAGVDDFFVKGMPFAVLLERVRFWSGGPFMGLPAHIRADTRTTLARVAPLSPPIARLRGSARLIVDRARIALTELLLFAPEEFGRTEIDRIRLLGVLDGILATLARTNALAQLRRADVMISVIDSLGQQRDWSLLRDDLGRLDSLVGEATFQHARQTLALRP
jgi:CheY-like chemotaxis protein